MNQNDTGKHHRPVRGDYHAGDRLCKFIAALSEFSAAVKQLTAHIAEMKNASEKKHDELWSAHDDHETRIREIEIKHGGKST